MSIKKLLLVPVFSLIGMNSFAEYQIQYPDVPVTFKDYGQWVPTEPVLTAWVNVGSPHDCTSAEPLENTQPLGISYPKTFAGCQQSQERSVTTSEKNSVTGAIRNQKTVKETNVITDATYTITSIGTKVVKECMMSASSGAFARWYDIATYDGYTITYGMGLQWAGATLVNTANSSKTYPKETSYVKDGYVYTRGALKSKSTHNDQLRTYYYYYEACREPVAP